MLEADPAKLGRLSKRQASIAMSVGLKSELGEYFFESEGCYITELSNNEFDPDLSIAQARVEPGVTTSWHWLKNTTERYCILSGVGIVEVGDAEQRDVCSGDVVLIQSMQRQRITNIGKEDLIFLAICTPRFEKRNYEKIQLANNT